MVKTSVEWTQKKWEAVKMDNFFEEFLYKGVKKCVSLVDKYGFLKMIV